LTVLTQEEPMGDVLEAFRRLNHREEGWIKVALDAA
jgi:threonine dehydrogenase-like Zn-dependent dehydrogenase